jgi:hypothetical protein
MLEAFDPGLLVLVAFCGLEKNFLGQEDFASSAFRILFIQARTIQSVINIKILDTVSPDIRFRGLLIASNPKIYLEILTGILNANVRLTIYLAWCSDLRIPPPFSVAPPPPAECERHKVRTYKEYHSVCPSSELGLLAH